MTCGEQLSAALAGLLVVSVRFVSVGWVGCRCISSQPHLTIGMGVWTANGLPKIAVKSLVMGKDFRYKSDQKGILKSPPGLVLPVRPLLLRSPRRDRFLGG